MFSLQETSNQEQAQDLIQLIETIMLYKFPRLTWEEIGAMLGLGRYQADEGLSTSF
ncbi:MAG: hypothetical protein BRC40_12755 [Cyanobacteria bacterium QH_8_48_120]|nr:MAG: hypothetical protein BRC34_12180 [Cyanobacteria bacterium QH_1_48_107]PSO53435.1 MAG: hypothetical protein BRC35_16120 [Cyanobacteria bacterium QH_10_48_56]PSO61589.1 MAG: hypothetical protein BRC38_17795 [Cyanobacteria bacterium QH_6_48_35]PSO64323.1 MAG: hypothetical protein BRC36_06815 [Cyanobacteria bacterium QH_2_48_84]PSO66914.1 MAG: hypothetical protein BRC39_02355 [Cyanobacteria bacterium QH_7_48_89]PSO70860.1 MAG: hypothetical protein BRC40_12755 [Cyanobacteria bacterium QH_8_